MSDEKVVKLSVVERPSRATTLKEFDEKVVEMRQWIEEEGADGFVMVVYRRDTQGFSSVTDYHVVDPMDVFYLPYLLAEKIRALRDRSTLVERTDDGG